MKRHLRIRHITTSNDTRYYLDGWPWRVPPIVQHLDGRSVRGVVLAVVMVLVFVACGLW